MANPFVHVELNTTDLGKAKSFYHALFEWNLQDVDMGGGASYTLIQVGEGTGGGMMKHPMPGQPSVWIPYVLVDDIRTATAKAKSLGANVSPTQTPKIRSRTAKVGKWSHSAQARAYSATAYADGRCTRS